MRLRIGVLAALAFATSLTAQSLYDFTLVRKRPAQFSSALEARLGVATNSPKEENEALGYESELGFDGHLWYHDEKFSEEQVGLDAYVGRDGAFLGFGKSNPGSNDARVELTGRFAQFYREGFYRDDEYIPTGRYEGNDYGVYFGFGRGASDDTRVEVGPYFHKYGFDTNDTTDPTYQIPDDYRVYGFRTIAENSTLQIDRQTGRTVDGYILTASLEGDRNDADRDFGTSQFRSTLPAGLWRARLHLEWCLPQRDLGTWLLRVDGKWAHKKDRVLNFDAWQPVGHQWADADIGLRFDLGALALTPFGAAQWAKVIEENGFGSTSDFFFGGGVKLRYDIADTFSLYADYSYLGTASRTPVSLTDDTLGEHQIFFGMILRIGAVRL